MEWLWLAFYTAVLFAMAAFSVSAGVAARHFPDDKSKMILLTSYAILNGLMMLAVGSRLFYLVWPFKGFAGLFGFFASIDPTYIDILALVYLAFWAAIMLYGYFSRNRRIVMPGN